MTNENKRGVSRYLPEVLIGVSIFGVVVLSSAYSVDGASINNYSSAMTVVSEVNVSEFNDPEEHGDETELVANNLAGKISGVTKPEIDLNSDQVTLLNKVLIEENERRNVIGLIEVENALKLAKLDAFGQIIVNADSEASLSRVVARLPSAMSEEEITHIQGLIKLSLPGEAGEQVADVLLKYYRYKEIEKSMVLDSEQPGSMQSALVQLTTMAQVRAEIMGQQYSEDLFGVQQRRAEYYLEKGIIEQDRDLSVEARKHQLHHLKVAAEQQGQYFSSASEEVQALNDEIARLRVAGQNESQILDKRAQLLGSDAAQQLAAMESQQNDWQIRYQHFEQEKQLILASVLETTEQQNQLDALFHRHYSMEELAGARAYDNQFAP